MKIQLKFTLAALVAALLPLGGYFAVSYEQSKTQVETAVRVDFEEGTAIGTQRLDDWFATNQAALKRLSKMPDLMRMDSAAAKYELQSAVKPYPWIRVAVATDAAGMQVLRSDAEKAVAVGDRPYVKDAKAKGIGSQVIVSRVNNKPAFFIAAPLTAEAGGDGVVAFGIDLDKISQAVVSKNAIVDQGVAVEQRFIALDDGKLLAHSDAKLVVAAKVGDLPDITTHPMWSTRPKVQGELMLMRYADAAGKRWVGAMKRSGLGWYVAVELPEEEVNKPLVEMQKRALIALGVATVFAALVAFIAGGLLTRPIRVLTAVTEGIAEGKFDDERLAKIKSKDEIGALALSIKRLSSSVKIAMDAMARKK